MLLEEMQDAWSDFADYWWTFLVGGILWFVIAVVVLRLDLTSVAAVGILVGVVLAITAVEEFVVASIQSGGWAVLRVLLGIFFLFGAVWCFVRPFDAFWSIAAALGLLLFIAGFFNIVYAAMAQPVNPLWWLGLVAGLLEIGLGFWASQQYLQTRGLLVLVWVGLYAIFRGITDLVVAFSVRSTRR